MSEQQRTQRSGQAQGTEHDVVTNAARPTDASFDALLDEIDSVLETNAEEYVRSFVQKGGQ